MNKVSPGENGFERKTLRTRNHESLEEMSLMMPWGELVFLMAPHAPAPALGTGTPRWRLIAYCVFPSCLGGSCSRAPWRKRRRAARTCCAYLWSGRRRRQAAGESTILRPSHLIEVQSLSAPILTKVNYMTHAPVY